MHRTQSAALLAACGVAAWTLLIGCASLALAQETPPGHMLQFDSNYGMVMGPGGVTWCSKLSTLPESVVQYNTIPGDYSRIASVTKEDSTAPLFEILLPPANRDEQPFILTMSQADKVYYARATKQDDGTTVIAVQAYLSPAEFAALAADPTPCLAIKAEDIHDPARLFSRLSSSASLTKPLRVRAPELFEEVEKLYKALQGPENPSEPWVGPKPEPEKFRQRLLDLLNGAIGDPNSPKSLYGRKLYSAKKLPVQIIEVMRQINDLGGAYNCDDELDQREDPFGNLRPKSLQEQPSPDPKPAPAISQKIRLLNRLLLEFGLDGYLQGTMYHWSRVLTGYGPCFADVAAGRFTNPPTAYRAHFASIMPIVLSAAGKLELLLDGKPTPALSPEQRHADLPFFTVGPDEEVAGPLKRVEETEVFAVQGTEVRWVNVQTEGKLPGQ